MGDALWHALRDTGDDHAPVAPAHEHDIPQLFIRQGAADVQDVRVQRDLRRRQMDALADAGQGRVYASCPAARSSRATSFQNQLPQMAAWTRT
jgi:hypothetical protein